MNSADPAHRPSPPRSPGPGFATRLLLAQSLVLVAGALTTWLVAATVGPGIFHEHLVRAGVADVPTEVQHAEEAFASALLISLLVALVAAAVMALAVTWYFSRRMQRAIAAVADAGAEIAAGRYTARVPRPGLGREFDQLTMTFSQLAQRLNRAETIRRRMLADLAHEMRTPLATLDAHIEALEDGVRTLDETTLSIMRSSTQRLSRLAQDINAVSQAQEGNIEIQRQLLNADDLIRSATQAAQAGYLAKGVTLIQGAPTHTEVSADPSRIAQVLANLLDNALRHTPAGGTVTLTARKIDRWVEFTLQDSGEGIEAAHLPQIFERFYQADTSRSAARGGSGIGLTISKALVEAHGGRISAHSDGPGTGATFTVRLPTPPR